MLNAVEIREERFKELESFAKTKLIIMDSSGLLYSTEGDFWKHIIPILLNQKSTILIPQKSVDKLKKYSKNLKDRDLAANAKRCLKTIGDLVGQKCVYVGVGSSKDSLADGVIQLAKIKKYKDYTNLLIITQDTNSAKEVLELDSSELIGGKKLEVKGIDQQGFLSEINEINDRGKIEKYVGKYKIFIDTCSLLHPMAEQFWKNITPILKAKKEKIIIPLRCIEELQAHESKNHSKDEKKRALADDAKKCLGKIAKLQKKNLIDIRGEETDNFADNVFQVVFTKFRIQYDLLLITQDVNLSKDILALNKSGSVKGKKIVVKKINKYGFLSNPDIYLGERGGKTLTTPAPEEMFQLCTKMTDIPDDNIPVSYLPGAGEQVYTSNGQVSLTAELGAGGEATVFSTDMPYVAKIYKKEKLTKRKFEKLKRMMTKKIQCEGICYPVDILYNSKHEFIGYLMPKAKGIELQKSVFGPKPLFLKKLPGWKKRDTVELCVTILEKIKYLHDRNIIMGDINPMNILVVSPKEVYFVDTDSFQIEDFPCPVGTINYTAPEIQKKHFSDFLRTMGNENFAVATLLFMIMLPGKPPYSQQGGEDPASNIIKMDFSYPFEKKSNKKTPEGPWRYIWSHLTYDLKKNFYHTFRQGGDFSVESKRLSVDDWLHEFKEFLELLDSGKYGKQDEMSEELFPTRFKKNPNVTYIETTCKKCGKKIYYTEDSKKRDICKDCYEYGNNIKLTKRCKECGKEFSITNNEYEYYKEHRLLVPKRCKECRERKKNHQAYTSGTGETTTGTSGKKDCFITTAVCEYFGKDDDCEELMTLRNYRDEWLADQEGGQELIEEYYKIAPAIVANLESSAYYADYCGQLMKEYITPCIRMIGEKKFAECREKYIAMVEYAKEII